MQTLLNKRTAIKKMAIERHLTVVTKQAVVYRRISRASTWMKAGQLSGKAEVQAQLKRT